MGSTNRRKIDKKPTPSKEEIAKIKSSLGLRYNDPLPRCPAKNIRKAKELGPEHLVNHHLCNDCRCRFTAGSGTEHYGVGYCVYHENAKKYKGHAAEVAHAQKVSMQQGYPDNLFRYDSKLLDFSEVRKAADEAHGRHQLREEVVVLRSALQKFIKQLDTQVDLSKSDIASLSTLTVSIARLARIELEVTDTDYVHKDQIKSWLYEILRAVQEEVKDAREQETLLKRLVLIPKPETGRN